MEITQKIRQNDMTTFQFMAVAICLVINMVDGFDVVAISFAAPEIAREWALPPTELGILFSSGLVGMVVGALFFGPVADRFGRRAVILLCLVIVSIGMLTSSMAASLTQLALLRILTGLGVGGMITSLNTMVAEYSSDSRRKLAISFLQSGYPIGGMLAGVVSVYLITSFGWRSVFVFGGLLSACMIPLVYFRLPESLDYLLDQRPSGALKRSNDLLHRLGYQPLEELPERESSSGSKGGSVGALFAPSLRVNTVTMWVCFLAVMCSWYFVVNWTPKVLVDAGLSLEGGISGGLLISFGAILGGLAFGLIASWIHAPRLVAIFMLLSVVFMTLFGQLETNLTMMLAVTFVIGFFLAGSMIGLYTIIPDIYPANVRNTGTGWAIGFGRIGAVAGPYLAGVLIAAGLGRSVYYFGLALPLVIAAIFVVRLPASKET
jgi:benzoate transport